MALRIDIEGVKHPLALVEGFTGNATPTTDLLLGLRAHGRAVSCPMLVGIDGLPALRAALGREFTEPVRPGMHNDDLQCEVGSGSAHGRPA